MVLDKWLNESIWPIESKLNKKSIEIGTKLGILEMISSGTTTFLDMYFFEDVIGKVSHEIGIRGFLGFALIDGGTPEYSSYELIVNCEKFVKRWMDNDLIKPVIAPHSIYTCGTDILTKSLDISNKYNTLMHIHCSETRDEVYNVVKKYDLRPIKLLEKYGLINNKMILAHCGWITKNEILDIKKFGAKVSHCPISNMKIGTGGFTPIPELMNSDVIVSLGTDGAASNNTLDMFETMKFCALIHKQHRWDPEILNSQEVFDFATIQGAKALNMDEYIGSIEVGKKGDIIIIDLKKPHLTPKHDHISNIVYAAKGSDVDSTIINGKPIMIEKNFIKLDVEKILDEAESCAKNLTS
jgi:5-methylthioadenosine/S-adenosylhomocysteine deaminase